MNAPGAAEGSTFWIYTKDPSTTAFTDLMNRALDKPKEQVQELVINNREDLLARLDSWKLAHRAAIDVAPVLDLRRVGPAREGE